MNRRISINGGLVPESDMRRWEQRRLVAVSRMLRIPKCNARGLAEYKLSIGDEEIMRRLGRGLACGRLAAKLMIATSRGKYRLCTVEIAMRGLSASQACDGVQFLMADQSEDSRLANLAACPDHYVFRCDGTILEVVETTGGSPFPTQMFMKLGNEEDAPISPDVSYPIQLSGVARMADGAVMGGIRHQFKDEDDGFRVRLCVAFPAMTPSHFIKMHQLHLACEFSNWFDHLGESLD